MSKWGKLASRYEDKENEKHRILALDGGGIRGILTLEVLIRMEEMLADATGRGSEFRLCQFFDYIGGTSTGAIIAAGLARGMSAKELLNFYQETGPAMFDKQFILSQDLGRQFIYARYNADLSRDGLNALGLPGIKPENVQKLDSIEYIDELRKVGKKVAEEVKIEHFGNFIS